MKKFLAIVILSVLNCNIAFAEWNNLKDIKDFKLSVSHEGDCKGKNYKKDTEIIIKYVLANSKINLVDTTETGEFIGVTILTTGNENLCISSIVFNTHTFNYSENSAGVKDFYKIESYNKKNIFFADNEIIHKSQLLNWVELITKQLVVDWTQAQK